MTLKYFSLRLFCSLDLKENTLVGTEILSMKVANVNLATRIVCKIANDYGTFLFINPFFVC